MQGGGLVVSLPDQTAEHLQRHCDPWSVTSPRPTKTRISARYIPVLNSFLRPKQFACPSILTLSVQCFRGRMKINDKSGVQFRIL